MAARQLQFNTEHGSPSRETLGENSEAHKRMKRKEDTDMVNRRFAVVTVSALSDRLYYGEWTLPPLKFLHLNLAQDIAVFYGRNRADYYMTEGLPLLLTTALPFAGLGIWKALRRRPSPLGSESRYGPSSEGNGKSYMLSLFAWVTLAVTLMMSLIAHKEVRFVYPLLPLLHILCGDALSHFFSSPLKPGLKKKTVLAALLAANVVIVVYTTQYHQRGVIDVTHTLRRIALQERPDRNVTAAFLMPCHSTPWRSHLVAPNLHAWALTCEPPLDVPLSERSGYLDEADQFYADPVGWLQTNMVERSVRHSDKSTESKREWPDYLVFFEQLERSMGNFARIDNGWAYREYGRLFNTHWHDDWRRQGDVVVWERIGAEE